MIKSETFNPIVRATELLLIFEYIDTLKAYLGEDRWYFTKEDKEIESKFNILRESIGNRKVF